MLCQICNQKPANVHMTKIINCEKTEIHVCEQCAKENPQLGINMDPVIMDFDEPFSFSNILAGLMDFSGTGSIPHQASRPQGCPSCRMDYEDFKKSGRFGCSECYEYFGKRLDPLFKRIHGHTEHTGKVPKRTGGLIRLKRDIEKLKYELRMAVENEEYEKAAQLRDRIRNLEKEDGR